MYMYARTDVFANWKIFTVLVTLLMQVKEGGERVEWNIFLQLDFIKEHFLNYTKKIHIYIF